jgi:predicted TIM-barrel fold metal-dependent hydrolase
MIIDAHNHPGWHGHDLTGTLENMLEHRIDLTWLLSWEAPDDEWDPRYNRVLLAEPSGPIPFSRCLSFKMDAPESFVLGYAPDPRRPGAIDRMRAAIEIHGVSVYGELKLRMMYDNPDAVRMYRFCGEHGLPVVVHLDYEIGTGSRYPRPNWWYGGGIEALGRAVEASPSTIFIGHGPGFWAHISDDDEFASVAYPSGPVLRTGRVPALMRKHANLWADLSAGSGRNALVRDLDHAGEFVDEFQNRLLFARDAFDGQLLDVLKSLRLPPNIMDKILSGNARRLVP